MEQQYHWNTTPIYILYYYYYYNVSFTQYMIAFEHSNYKEDLRITYVLKHILMILPIKDNIYETGIYRIIVIFLLRCLVFRIPHNITLY